MIPSKNLTPQVKVDCVKRDIATLTQGYQVLGKLCEYHRPKYPVSEANSSLISAKLKTPFAFNARSVTPCWRKYNLEPLGDSEARAWYTLRYSLPS